MKPKPVATCPTCGQRIKQTPEQRKAYMANYMKGWRKKQPKKAKDAGK